MAAERFTRFVAVPLLVIGGLGAGSVDAPLVDAVKRADTAAVRTLISNGRCTRTTRPSRTS